MQNSVIQSPYSISHMKKTILIFIANMLLINFIHAQYFSKIIDHDSTGQCKHYMVFPKQDYIYVIGDYIDSARIAIRPFWAKFDYQGNRIAFDTLWDFKYNNYFVLNSSYAFTTKSDSIVYISSLRIVDNPSKYDNYLFEMNIYTGKLLTTNTIDYETYGLVVTMQYDTIKNNIVAATTSNEDHSKIEALELDSNLNIGRRIIVRFDEEKNVTPYWIKKKNNNEYQIIGEIGSKGEMEKTVKLVQFKADTTSKLTSFKQLETSVNLSSWLFPVRKVHERLDGDFVIAPSLLVPQVIGTRDWNFFSHPVRANANFDTIRWERKMYNKPDYFYPYQNYKEIISIKHDSEYIVSGDESDSLRTDAFILYKISSNGDSIWYKKYIPGDAKPQDLGINLPNMIAPSPRGGLVIAGEVGDWRNRKFRSFLMYIDDDGCLIPGCNEVVSIQDLKLGKAKPFKIFPNPFTEQLQILSRWQEAGPLHFQLIDLNGKIVWSSTHYCQSGDQLFWSLESVPAGNYILQITDRNKKILQAEKLIRI